MSLYDVFQKWKNKSKNSFYYTAVVLNYFDRLRLIARFRKQIPKGWKTKADHMTINVGQADEGPIDQKLIGKKNIPLNIVSIAKDDRVIAVEVQTDIPSENQRKHITIAINPQGGQAKHSNELEGWTPIEPFVVRGTIQVVEQETAQDPKADKGPPPPPSAPAPNDPSLFVQSLREKGKPDPVIKMAMKGKFPNLSSEELESYF